MENASKALIIAGAILLAILIIGLGMFIYNQAADTLDGAQLDGQKVDSYNREFLQYEGTKKGTQVQALCDLVKTHNLGKTDDISQQVMIQWDTEVDATGDSSAVLSDSVATEDTVAAATEAKAKEIRSIVEGLIALAVKEKDNFDTVTVTAKVARKDADGKRVKEVKDGKKVTVYDEVQKTIKKDQPSRLHARRQMLKVLYPVTEVPTKAAGKKKNTKEIDLVAKLFDEIAPKYATRNGGYTRIVKIGQRKGDGAMEVIIELV